MAKTEKRWQLLLVADDGKIIPFKRIKGVAVGGVVLLVLLGLLSAGLAWRWTAETVRHRRTKARLVAAEQQVTHFKREHELIAAELVLAEARMEKAGLPVSRRQERAPRQLATPSTDGEPTDPPAADADPGIAENDPPPDAAAPPAALEAQAEDPVAAPPEAASAVSSTAVSLGDLELEHDTTQKVLRARFRINNDGPRSSPIAGRCAVVLKNAAVDREQWQVMPDMPLTNGTPDGSAGHAFRIANFIDMEILRPVEGDPSIFTTAAVYVFDRSGATLLVRDFPIELPAPATPAPASGPTTAPEASAGAAGGPLVEVDGLNVVFDAGSKTLAARFRVRKTDAAAAPLAGRCVVVLHGPQMDPDAWQAMPIVDLVNGEPDGTRGQSFRIAGFKEMEINVEGPTDPSAFTAASIHVFAADGTRLLRKEFPVDLPAPEPQAATVGGASSAGAAPSAPTTGDPSSAAPIEPTTRDSRARF